ncbi:MAG TPA: ClpXP protease specificity-enhancing factor SspB [Vicinamibacteria bacterium]|nr:ClpXP protease specificity-enhancing factor SspB [Vicinamibacteria bacterium]
MAGEDKLDYARLVREALRDVPRQALRLAASEGLPGEHHFYLTFRTSHPGVAISPALLARHPRDMTIVLQHQFWDLAVGEEAFSVTLRFGGAAERLHVPFDALLAFADPSAQFGLHYEPVEENEGRGAGARPEAAEPEPAAVSEAPAEASAGNVVDIRAFRRRED